MKKLLLYSSIPILTGLFLINCDETVSPSNTFTEGPEVQRLMVSPDSVNFIPADGYRDTTLVIQIEATIKNVSTETSVGYAIRSKESQNLILSGELIAENSADFFKTEADLETTTTSFEEYIVEVFAYNKNGSGNFFQTPISISGFSNNRPEITATTSPGIINRPTSGSILAVFTATVTDSDGDETISDVFIRVIQNGSDVTGSPFNMFDNGSSFGDTTANDLTFTWSQEITPTTENPNRDFDIEFYAVDLGGLISDTVKTTFSIRE